MAQVKFKLGNVEVTATGDLKQTVQEIGQFLEFYGADRECQYCNSENLRPSFRESQGYTFYELKCADCGASLSFGQTKHGGTLFPHRKNEDGTWDKDKKGWKPPWEKKAPQQSQQSPDQFPDKDPFSGEEVQQEAF